MSLINPEIINDEFASLIQEACSQPWVKTCIEIGASDGRGSTQAILAGLKEKPDASLSAIEVEKERYDALTKIQDLHLMPHWASSVRVCDIMSEEQVREFYDKHRTNLNRIPLDVVLGWIQEGKKYIAENWVAENILPIIVQAKGGADKIDFVLIDGSPFTAQAELACVWGARIIALDDTNDIKNFETRQALLHTSAYRLVVENLSLRNGYAIFERTC